jgi:hypothetical protein
VTGQAGWYDVRVRIYPAQPDEAQESWPQFPPMKAFPGMATARKLWQMYVVRSAADERNKAQFKRGSQ